MATKAKPAKAKEYDEFEIVTRWRFQQLVALGLSPDQAVGLIEKPDVAHKAQRLAEAGCPPAIIVSLLEGE